MKNILIAFLLIPLFFSCHKETSTGSEKEVSMGFKERMEAEKSDDIEIEEQITSLLSKMTLDEKVGQMMQINNSEYAQASSRGEYYGSPPDILISIDTTKLIHFLEEYKIGSFLNGVAVPAQQWFEYSQLMQEINMRYSRLKIPMIYGVDHMHGANYVEGTTIFPHSINMAATFDPDYSIAEARTVGMETAHLGHHWVFCPVVDLGKNPLWARFYETYGEDPYLTGLFGAAYVETLQNNPDIAPYKQAATAKHFIGYSDPRNGWDRTPAEISDQTLQEFFVPPFQDLVDAGIKTFMINGGEINGIPVHASHDLLTTLLRDQMGFKGVVVTDWEDVIRLHRTHKVAKDIKESTYKAIMAGVDMSMTPYETDFFGALKELVEEGTIPMERIDLSVSRILRLKFEIGLFDNPYPSADRIPQLRAEENVAAALNAARESLVLIKNDDVLPLGAGSSIVVTGANATSKKALAGGWTLRWIPTAENLFPEYMPTVFDALKTQFGDAKVSLASPDDLAAKATAADAIVVVVGEEPYAETPGNINDQRIQPDQADLIESANATGKPVIVVLVAGRPRLVTDNLPAMDAFIWAGLPGFEGGTAIAEVISGAINPSGKMPFTFPAQPNHWYPYNGKNMEHFFNHADSINTIAGFGHGLSYTDFTYSELKLSSSELSDSGKITASITVTNSGDVAGKEAVLWFIKDEIGSVTRPLKELKHFEKVFIEAGESKNFSFEISAKEHLSYPIKTGEKILEPGDFQVIVGGLTESFSLN